MDGEGAGGNLVCDAENVLYTLTGVVVTRGIHM